MMRIAFVVVLSLLAVPSWAGRRVVTRVAETVVTVDANGESISESWVVRPEGSIGVSGWKLSTYGPTGDWSALSWLLVNAEPQDEFYAKASSQQPPHMLPGKLTLDSWHGTGLRAHFTNTGATPVTLRATLHIWFLVEEPDATTKRKRF